MLINFTWGPAGGQKHHARMAFLPPAPLKYIIEHTFQPTGARSSSIIKHAVTPSTVYNSQNSDAALSKGGINIGNNTEGGCIRLAENYYAYCTAVSGQLTGRRLWCVHEIKARREPMVRGLRK
jgi:hypothetical protein